MNEQQFKEICRRIDTSFYCSMAARTLFTIVIVSAIIMRAHQ